MTKETASDKFKASIKALIEQSGLSQKEIAEKMGVEESVISLWKSGKRIPLASGFFELASIVGKEVVLK